MNDNIVPLFHYSEVFQSPDAGRSQSEPSAGDVAARFNAGLIVALLISLGLWGAICLVVSSLGDAWLW